MKDYGRVRSTVCPKPMVSDELSVWKHTDITPVTEHEGTDQEFMGYEFNMVQYTKDEYIQVQADENAAVKERLQTTEQQLTDTQLALCDVYELLVGGV